MLLVLDQFHYFIVSEILSPNSIENSDRIWWVLQRGITPYENTWNIFFINIFIFY